jgi:hypothetical protein
LAAGVAFALVNAWGFIWIMVILKIPLLTLCWLVWWAIRQEPELEDEPQDGGGGTRRPHRSRRRPPRRPRGPHGDPAPLPSPPRVRTNALGRQVERERD